MQSFKRVYCPTRWTYNQDTFEWGDEIVVRAVVEANFNKHDAFVVFNPPDKGKCSILPDNVEYMQFYNSMADGHILLAFFPTELYPTIYASNLLTYTDFLEFAHDCIDDARAGCYGWI